jgi:hypothetical protein
MMRSDRVTVHCDHDEKFKCRCVFGEFREFKGEGYPRRIEKFGRSAMRREKEKDSKDSHFISRQPHS